MNVTTLIPAFKPKYLPELLTGLSNQTVKPARVIVSDDSPDQAFVAALGEGRYRRAVEALNLTVVEGPRRGPFENLRHLLAHWNHGTELVHFLFDDDLIYPEFYERHLRAHASQPFPCTVSRRWTATETGMPVAQLPLPKNVAQHPQRLVAIDASALFATTVPYCNNWLGEFSNAVLRAEVAERVLTHQLSGISYYGLLDIGLFLSASLAHPIGFLNEALGAFRLGPQQNTSNMMSKFMKLGHFAWLALALGGKRAGRLDDARAASCYQRMGELILKRYADHDDMARFREVLPQLMAGAEGSEPAFLAAWHAYISEPPYAAPPGLELQP